MKQTFFILACTIIISLGFSNYLFASDIKYSVDDIPKQLLKDAKAVVRNEDITVRVNSNGKLVKEVKYAITILNKNGESRGYFLQSYDKFHKVHNIKARMYDSGGKEIKKSGGFEILDYALIPEGSAYYDGRIKAIDPENFAYPYTMEYSYEVSFNEVIYYPGWNPITDFEVAVERSKFTLIVSKQAECRHFEKNIIIGASIQETPENTITVWELTNTQAIAYEQYSPPLNSFTPVVLLAPTKVQVEGYEGDFSTWQGFGQWINQLNHDKNNLSDETKAKIRQITEGITDERVKVKKLYEYMQNKTRYISITIGIGGYQPFDAETVDRLCYGDCKALSNYMKSLLEVVGIKSCYSLIYSGRENPELLIDFPSTQFNHAILCVPTEKDTIWLECTSQRKPFNYLGTSTNDRYALVIEENGGKLVKTPVLSPESHLESRAINVVLDKTGNGIVDVESMYSGINYDDYVQILMSDQADRKKMVTKSIHIPNFELDNFTIKETKAEKPFVTENLNLTITNYCTKVGDRLMLCLNMMNKMGDSPFQATTRKTPVLIKWPVYEVDTVTYELPEGYTLEKIPSKVSLLSDFGEYTTQVSKTGNTIQYVRTFKVYKAEHPVERYDEIVTFFDKIVTADENKVMLTRVM